MSRWIEQFEAHPFQEAWKSLKASLDETKVDDETVMTSVQEVARLRKVVSYIDGIINGIDPELVPLTTWDNFNSQTVACTSQIGNYNSNKNIAHINKANEHVDNLLTYVRPYMIVEGDISKALQESIKRYTETVEEYGSGIRENTDEIIAKIRNYKEQGDALFEDIENTNKSVGDYKTELFGNDDDESGVKQDIEQLVEGITEKHEKIGEFYEELLVGDGEELSTKQSVLKAKEAVEGEKEKIEELLGSVESEVKELDRFHTKIFGEKNDDDELEGGLSEDLDKLMGSMDKFEKEQKLKYKALNEQIEELLPGATSAGLASAYKEMKETFGEPIKRASRLFYWSIAGLVALSLFVAIDSIGLDGIRLIETGDWPNIFKGLVNKLPYYVPIVWLAFYATRRRSEYQRLQQEYAHKESLAKSYNSYKQQILDLGDDDKAMQKEFIMKAVDAIAYNASKTLDGKHGDKMPIHDMIEKTVERILKTKGY